MMSWTRIVCWSALVFVGLSMSATAADPQRPDLAATDELPAALRAVDVRPQQILTGEQAGRVRGEWILTVNLPYFATQLQGNQPFTLQLWTLGAGIAPGTPVYVRISVGH